CEMSLVECLIHLSNDVTLDPTTAAVAQECIGRRRGYAMGLRGCSFLDLNDICSIFPISGENNLQRYTQKIRIPKLLIGWGAGIVKEHVEPGGGELSIQLVGGRLRACAEWSSD